jgi:hypothetical protein
MTDEEWSAFCEKRQKKIDKRYGIATKTVEEVSFSVEGGGRRSSSIVVNHRLHGRPANFGSCNKIRCGGKPLTARAADDISPNQAH